MLRFVVTKHHNNTINHGTSDRGVFFVEKWKREKETKRNWRIFYDWQRGRGYLDLSIDFGLPPEQAILICDTYSKIYEKKLKPPQIHKRQELP